MTPSKLTRRDFLGWAASAAVGGPVFLAACGRGESGKRPSPKKSVKFLNWTNYVGRDTLSRFESETGILVNCDYFKSEEKMFGKISAQAGGYDVLVAPDHAIPRLKAAGLISPTPKEKLKNIGNIAASFRDPACDPGLAYSVPYLWGTTGLGVNAAHFPKPPDSWRALWDDKNKGRVSMLDNGREALQCALLILGLPTDSKDPARLAQARDLLLKQRPLVKKYDSATYADALAAGELWLSQGWSGDLLRAGADGNKAGFVLPTEGAFLWVDSLCLLRGSESKEEVLRFLDYLLEPAVAAEIVETTYYATPNEKALALLKPAFRDDVRVFPSDKMRSRLRPSALLDAQAEELWARTWKEVQV